MEEPRCSRSMNRRNSMKISTPLDCKLQEHEIDFIDYHPLKVQCVTWNVNSSAPTSKLDKLFENGVLPDIICFCIQEMDLSLDSVVLNDAKYEEDWIKLTIKALPKIYNKICHKRLAGIFLILFALNTNPEAIRYVSTAHVGTGILGIMGNKGAVGVSLHVWETSICFISAHLAAQQDEVEKRNQNFSLINQKMNFYSSKQLAPMKIDYHDAVFWCGDLNYRISNLTFNQIMDQINLNNFESLYLNDQLKIEQEQGRAFVGYCEAPITFAPTYKFVPGTSHYDLPSGRIPSYCDRVLWLENEKNCNIQVVSYSSLPNMIMSDHQPVIGRFDMKVCMINSNKYNILVETIRLALDAQENKMIPSIKLNKNELNFGDVHYKVPQIKSITLTNNGSCDVNFQFLSRTQNIHTYDLEFICPSWIIISEISGQIAYGKSVTITFEINLSKTQVAAIDENNTNLSSILILHLVGGRDHFICIDANYVISCFGSSAQNLSQLKNPMKAPYLSVDIDMLVASDVVFKAIICSRLPSSIDVKLIPKELINLTQCLMIYGLRTPGLFTRIGLFHELISIMNSLDTSNQLLQSNFKTLSVHSVAESYLLFIDMLKEPLLPIKFVYSEIYSDGKINPVKVVKRLDPVRHAILIYVLTFMDEVLINKELNKVDPLILSTVFANVIIREDASDLLSKSSPPPIKNCIKIINLLLKLIHK